MTATLDTTASDNPVMLTPQAHYGSIYLRATSGELVPVPLVTFAVAFQSEDDPDVFRLKNLEQKVVDLLDEPPAR